MLGKVKQIHSMISIKRERVLPVAGNVLVRRMQKVSPTDVIVVAPMVPEFILLDVAQGLNVGPDRADELLQREAGEELGKGDVIAGPVGIFQRVLRAPNPGLIRIAGEGKVLFEISTPDHELLAGMDGTVTNIIPERGAIIETNGALIQGIWGNGKIAYGVIQPVSNDLIQELVPEQLNIGHRGIIITAGFCRNPEVLEVAGNLPIKGLILGSLSADLIPLAKSCDYPILVIDGFGNQPTNRAAEEILVTNKDRNVALNAQTLDPFKGDFPEVIISQSARSDTELPSEAETLRAGKRVIIINGPDKNKIGKIESVSPRNRKMANGIEARIAEVSLPNDEQASVPLYNLEIMS
jgi:hypothetical protein